MLFKALSLLSLTSAVQAGGTFAVLRFSNEGGKFSTEGRMDPIVSPGNASEHSHGIMGGNAFSVDVQGHELLNKATCTNAKVAADKSNYWVPELYFQSPVNGTFKKVELFYMNVYYFFDDSNDEIEPFPPGLQIVSGDAMARTPPSTSTLQLDPHEGPIQAVQWTCPVLNGDPARYPTDSDGTKAGMQDPNNDGAGVGFPVINCDGYASPLRQDIHMPSCYNPKAGIDNYKNNMQFPHDNEGKLDCPSGWTHVPHMFYEVYWNTPLFANDWDPNGQDQPFVLSSGDRTGYGSHADFISGWDQDVLRDIIAGCDAGDSGMDQCSQAGTINDDDTCVIKSEYPEAGADTWVKHLPGGVELQGWGVGGY